ncbi:MAG: hypothetical protein FLDDKLPJ_03320 [Phycisphaerae bacterium]|nr:hypothetical protein [Phycisphaerae bacterium]
MRTVVSLVVRCSLTVLLALVLRTANAKVVLSDDNAQPEFNSAVNGGSSHKAPASLPAFSSPAVESDPLLLSQCCNVVTVTWAGSPDPPGPSCSKHSIPMPNYFAYAYDGNDNCTRVSWPSPGVLGKTKYRITIPENSCDTLPSVWYEVVAETEPCGVCTNCCKSLAPYGAASPTNDPQNPYIYATGGGASITDAARSLPAGSKEKVTLHFGEFSASCMNTLDTPSITIVLRVTGEQNCGGGCGTSDHCASPTDPPAAAAGAVRFTPSLVGDDGGVSAVVGFELLEASGPGGGGGVVNYFTIPGGGAFRDYEYDERLVASTYDSIVGEGGNVYTYNAGAILQGSNLEYVFSDTRTGSQWVDEEGWIGTRLPLRWLKRVNEDGSRDSLVEGSGQVVQGRYVPEKWKSVANNALSIDFIYDGTTGLLSRVNQSDGRIIYTDYLYQEVIVDWEGGNDLTRNYALLTHVETNCASCPAYDYQYDEFGRLTSVLDDQDNIIRGLRYQDVDDDNPNELTKVFRQLDGGSEELVFTAAYDESNHKVTHYRHQSNSNKEVEVEESADGFDDVTKRRLYSDINPDLSGSGDSYSYLEYMNGSDLTRLDAALPRGNTRRKYIATSGNDDGQIVVEAIYNGASEITLAQYDYDIVDQNPRVVWETDVRGQVTYYEYDYGFGLAGIGMLTKVVESLVTTVDLGSVQQTREYVYNNNWQLEDEIVATPAGTVTRRREYDDYGNVTRQIEDNTGLALATDYVYDSANRLSIATDPRGVTSVWKHTSSGALEREYTLDIGSSSAPALRVYEYDSHGHVTAAYTAKQDGPIASPASFSPDSSNSIKTGHLYDPFGRRTAMIDDQGGLNLTTSYEYDHQDRVVKTTTPGGIFTRMIYDGRGRESTQIVGATGGRELTTTFEYDGNSNLTRQTDPNGIVVTYEYDLYDRRTKMTRSGA